MSVCVASLEQRTMQAIITHYVVPPLIAANLSGRRGSNDAATTFSSICMHA